MYSCKAINFPLSAALAASHILMCHIFHCSIKIFYQNYTHIAYMEQVVRGMILNRHKVCPLKFDQILYTAQFTRKYTSIK